MKGIKILTDVIYYLLLMFFSVLLLHFVGSLPCKYEQTPNLNEKKKASALTSTSGVFLKKYYFNFLHRYLYFLLPQFFLLLLILTFFIPLQFLSRVSSFFLLKSMFYQ